MRQQFFPPYYRHEFLHKMEQLKQGSNTVHAYYQEFKYYMHYCDIEESKDDTMNRFFWWFEPWYPCKISVYSLLHYWYVCSCLYLWETYTWGCIGWQQQLLFQFMLTTLLHLVYFCYLLPVTNYLITKLLITDNFSACRAYLAENRLSFPSAPCWVRHSYLSKGLRSIPYTCGSLRLFSGAVAGEWSAFGKWNLVRKHLYSVLKFTVTCYYGT